MDEEAIDNLKRLDKIIDECVNLVGEALGLVNYLEPEQKSSAHDNFVRVIGAMFYVRSMIPKECRKSADEVPIPDGPLTPEQETLVSQLTSEQIAEIDEGLIKNASHQWRKVARVVAGAMSTIPGRIKGIPDIYYAQRVKKLVEYGRLESDGDPDYMRFSEVRLAQSSEQRSVD